ncbi:peptidase C14 [Thelephora ganbajun]|uniref:Peptidase C14 n=1 Tax=Thelephora ganbajun TaxID=370292 RepID=A0ACB6ZTS7_THEGA|nr:peptidase C14 [Thelephora ganbajun]
MPRKDSIPTRGRSTEKKALLIGISYHKGSGRPGEKLEPIPTSIPNVTKFAAFLKECCGFTNTVVMTDEDGVGKRYRPTKRNLKREIRALRRGVKPGDRLVFYFAGHSDQVPCKTGSEEDGMDEVLVALGGLKIQDNTLHNWLVKDLPKGSALTAIFDSCTSGTLLDLHHYYCNDVYRPWVNKGARRSNTFRNNVVRKNCKGTRSPPPSRRRSTYRKGSGEASDRFPSLLQLIQTGPVPMTLIEDPDKHYGERCASPERQFACDGWCRKMMPRKASLTHADVISISSSNDGQVSWDASTRNGDSISMTTFLIKILKQYPEITYSELMTRLNHAMYSFTMKMHDAEREKHARRKAGRKDTDSEDIKSEEESRGEMDNFQDLQLGSITPVDMDRLFRL